MNNTAEMLRRHAVVLQRLRTRRYNLSLSVRVHTDDERAAQLDRCHGARFTDVSGIIDPSMTWNGLVTADVSLRSLQLTARYIEPVMSLLDANSPYTTAWINALCQSHLSDFEKFVATFTPELWEHVVNTQPLGNLWAFLVAAEHGPSLRFELCASRIARWLDEDLRRAASEGERL